MARPGERSYRFAAAGHWRAGAMTGFAAADGGLVVAPPQVAKRISGSEEDSIAAVGPCGRLVWLRPKTGELFVLHEFGAERQGRIGARCPRAIHSGARVLWACGKTQLYRYAARTLQELGRIELPGLIAGAPDGCDGLWLLVRGKNGVDVRWLDASGCFQGAPIALPGARFPVAIASDPGRRRLAIIDGVGAEWRLHIVDLAKCEALPALRFPLARGDLPPRWIAVDGEGDFHVAPMAAPGLLLSVSPDGFETARQPLPLPDGAAVAGLLWQDGLILCAADGLYRLVSIAEDDEGATPATGVFITPTLKSPPGMPGGWNRAEIKVRLPAGARLAATIFASSSDTLAGEVDAALADAATPPAARLAALDALIDRPDIAIRSRRYSGDGEQWLHLLLDGIAAPYLWLKLELECPPGAEPAMLEKLRVRYPDRSWLDELPAIYRDEPASATQLRQFLAPFEALYDELDETIDRLPAQIDPATAPADRLPWLLGWLGFPPTAGLPAAVQRALLMAAGGLLEGRGTIAALRDVLCIVTGNRVSVEDAAAATGFWVIGSGPARLSPRLGRDTRVVSRLPIGFRPGSGMRLGEEPLPPFCTDIGGVLGATCGLVTIRIAIDPAARAVVLPIVESLLAMFVPAHCRIDLRLAPAGRTRPGGRLDRGWLLADAGRPETAGNARLDDADGIELGSETEIGGWQLPSPDPPPFTIDGNAALDGVRRLA